VICAFAQTRFRKATHLAETEVYIDQDDLAKFTKREAVLKARSRIWMAEFKRILEKMREQEIDDRKPDAIPPP